MNGAGVDSRSSLIDEDVRRRFEQAWFNGVPLTIEACWPASERADYVPTLEELVLIDM